MAFLVLSLAILGLVSVQVYALRAQSKMGERNVAAVIAASRLNALEGQLDQDFGRVVAAARAPLPDHPDYQLAIAERALPGLDNLKEVAVCVYWTDAHGPHEYCVWSRFLKR